MAAAEPKELRAQRGNFVWNNDRHLFVEKKWGDAVIRVASELLAQLAGHEPEIVDALRNGGLCFFLKQLLGEHSQLRLTHLRDVLYDNTDVFRIV